MRVLFLARSLGLGGAEGQLVALADGLRQLGHEVLIVTFYPGGPVWERASTLGLPLMSIDKRGRWDLWGAAGRFGRLVSAAAPDVVYSFLQGPNIFAALFRRQLGGRPLVWGVRASSMLFDFYGLSAKVALAAECRLAPAASAVVCNSRAGALFYAGRGVNRERLHVIENGIDTQRFYPDAEAAKQLRFEFAVPVGRRVIGLVGRLDPIKDHATALAACAELVARGWDIEIWVVGAREANADDPLSGVVRQSSLQERVRWLGVRHDMRDIYCALDVLLSTSLSEGFPNVIAEAASCGTPCVVSDVGDSARIVDDPKLVIPVRSPAAAADAVERVLSGEAGDPQSWHARIADRFDARKCIVATENLLAGLIRGRTSS